MKVIKGLKQAWIVIFISKKQFADKWYDGIKDMVILISNYIVNYRDFEKSISFILTKGLHREEFIEMLAAFKNSPMFRQ